MIVCCLINLSICLSKTLALRILVNPKWVLLQTRNSDEILHNGLHCLLKKLEIFKVVCLFDSLRPINNLTGTGLPGLNQ